jgi:predicted regulator of Ras-like GTPase activity (Roadblock/LC7/MglB family)
MKETLQELNQARDLLGSMVMTPDGIMVAAALGPDYEEDAVAAVISSLLVGLKQGLAGFEREQDFTSCTINASEGRILLVDMENSFLVTISPTGIMLSSEDQAIKDAIHKIKNRRVA